ncbi:MAG: hypothetical protein NT105_20280 [Verrucomicrobia bacterium]|nr:hypothetical protein [Verrucomicrobiota bacterium]
MNTLRSNHKATKAGRKWKLTCGLWASVLAALIAIPVIPMVAQAQNTQPSNVNQALVGNTGGAMTLGQLALKFARSLTPPFLGTRPADAIAWLQGSQIGEQAGHQPPLSPLGGWGDPGRVAKVGDLTVLLAQQLGIAPTAAGGGQPTEQDYQNALVSFIGSTTMSTYTAIANIYSGWVSPTINPLGPAPSSGEQTRSSPTP